MTVSLQRRIIGLSIAALVVSLTGSAFAAGAPTLTGLRKVGLGLESEYYVRDMEVDSAKERLRVARQALVLSYGLLPNLDLFAKAGLGHLTFDESDLSRKTRAHYGGGMRAASDFGGGYYTALALQYLTGHVSSFETNGSVVDIEDDWSEAEGSLIIGSKDLVRDPEPDLRVFAGLRYSSRTDEMTPAAPSASFTVEQDTAVGGVIGFDFSDSNVFRFSTVLGTGDRSGLSIYFGLNF